MSVLEAPPVPNVFSLPTRSLSIEAFSMHSDRASRTTLCRQDTNWGAAWVDFTRPTNRGRTARAEEDQLLSTLATRSVPSLVIHI